MRHESRKLHRAVLLLLLGRALLAGLDGDLALAQTNLAVAPAPIPFAALPAAKSNQPAVNSVSLQWGLSSDQTVIGYKVRYGLQSSTNHIIKNVGNTNFTVLTNLFVGSNYTAWCVSYNSSGVESQPSNFIDFTVAPPSQQMLSIRPYSYAIETYGHAGYTNAIQASVELPKWTTITTFNAKTGSLFRYIEVAGPTNRFFRVIKL